MQKRILSIEVQKPASIGGDQELLGLIKLYGKLQFLQGYNYLNFETFPTVFASTFADRTLRLDLRRQDASPRRPSRRGPASAHRLSWRVRIHDLRRQALLSDRHRRLGMQAHDRSIRVESHDREIKPPPRPQGQGGDFDMRHFHFSDADMHDTLGCYHPSVMIDSHCHLADPKFNLDLQEVVFRAKDGGVTTMVTISDDVNEAKRCIAISDEYSGIYCTVGVHPHNAKDWSEGTQQMIRRLAQSSDKVKAIGEIGLDDHYMNSPKEIQLEAFRDQILIAQEMKLPVVVHCRDAIGDVRVILEHMRPEKVVLHCCTEAWEDVKPLVEMGYMLSFTGIATYPSSDAIRMTIRECPLEQMMIETDAPYLAPVPHRGKRNEPLFVREVAKVVAGIKGLTIGEVDTATTANAMAFFGI